MVNDVRTTLIAQHNTGIGCKAGNFSIMIYVFGNDINFSWGVSYSKACKVALLAFCSAINTGNISSWKWSQKRDAVPAISMIMSNFSAEAIFALYVTIILPTCLLLKEYSFSYKKHSAKSCLILYSNRKQCNPSKRLCFKCSFSLSLFFGECYFKIEFFLFKTINTEGQITIT